MKKIAPLHPLPHPLQEWFRLAAHSASEHVGSPTAFIAAVTVIAVWSLTGPLFGFSDTWQLVINTGTTIVTFLMVFLIQNAQNREAKATQLKLDELIRALKGARNSFLDVEDSPEDELRRLHAEFKAMRVKSLKVLACQHRLTRRLPKGRQIVAVQPKEREDL